VFIKIHFKHGLQIFHLSFIINYVFDIGQLLLQVESYVFDTETTLLEALKVLHIIGLEDDALALVSHVQQLGG
jgi:hypothetical protein